MIGGPTTFNPVTEDWIIYQEQMEQYFRANKITEEDIQVATLISLIGTPVYKILRDLCYPKNPKDKKYKDLCELLKKQYSPQLSDWRERAKFYELAQEPNEPVTEWYARIRSASVNCNFGERLANVLKDKFVTGLHRGQLYDRVCEEDVEVELEKLISIAQKKESTPIQQVNKISTGYSNNRRPQPVRSRPPQPKPAENRRGSKPKCKHCGKNHNGVCKYAEYTCNLCKRVGHLSSICRKSRSNNFVEVESELYNIVDRNSSDIHNHNPFSVVVEIDKKEHKMLIDSGSAISCMSSNVYKKHFYTHKLNDSNIKLKGYTGNPIKPTGHINLDVCYEGKVRTIRFYIVDRGGPSLLGRDWLGSFQMGFQTINHIEASRSVEDIISKFPDVFSGKLGHFKHERISLEMKPNAKPIFLKPRTVPLAFIDLMNRELDRMVEDGVLSPVESSQWGTPLVPVLKADGTVRLCGDYKSTVNKYLVDVKYPLPRVEEIFAKLHKGEHFTKIDLNQAYTQFELDDDARRVLTWSTHKGLFTMNRMPYGIAPATAKFQKHLEQLFMGMENVVNFVDDILITGPNRDEHLKTLEAVLKKLSEAGLTAKKEKCKFFQEQVEYMGHIISRHGLRKTKGKVEAIIYAPEPSTISQVRSFCGMVNYYAKFVPNLAKMLRPIYDLLMKTEKFCWTEKCQEAFEEIKEVLASDSCLVHFNPELPIVLTTDASAEGISAVLSHVIKGEERMIGCVSRTLMPAEKNYSTIHREALAIYYGVTKFHQYLYGHRWTLKTDHRPLIALFGEHRGIPAMYANRLQRWAAYLSSFNYVIQHVKGENNPVADCLSRVPRPVTTISEEYSGKGNYINFAVTSEEWPIDNKKIAEETKKDPAMMKTIEYLKTGWPKTVSAEMNSFHIRREEITCEDGVVLWGHRVIIPEGLRKRLLSELHGAHFGMVRMKSQARTWMWWPGIDQDIEKLCKSCLPCLQSRQDPAKAAETPWPVAHEPFQRVHVDYLGPIKGKMFLILTDAFTKWPEVYEVKTMTAQELEAKLRDCFSRFGIPRTLVSDNGRQLVAKSTEIFFRKNGIEHITSPPYNPQSNGAAENAVKTFKTKMKAALSDPRNNSTSFDTIISRFLISYRNTPHATTKTSPAQLMLGRNVRTTLTIVGEKPISHEKKEAEDPASKPSRKSKKKIREFIPGEHVMARDYRENNKKTWVEAKIEKRIGRSMYICEINSGERWKRHINQLISRVEEETTSTTGKTKPSPKITPEVARTLTNRIGYGSTLPSSAVLERADLAEEDVGAEHDYTENSEAESNINDDAIYDDASTDYTDCGEMESANSSVENSEEPIPAEGPEQQFPAVSEEPWAEPTLVNSRPTRAKRPHPRFDDFVL